MADNTDDITKNEEEIIDNANSSQEADDPQLSDEEIHKLIKKRIAELVFYFAFVFLCIFLFLTFVGQRTEVSGESMYDTLDDGDSLWIDKLSYHFNDPERFDIVVFPVYASDYDKNVIEYKSEELPEEEERYFYNNITKESVVCSNHHFTIGGDSSSDIKNVERYDVTIEEQLGEDYEKEYTEYDPDYKNYYLKEIDEIEEDGTYDFNSYVYFYRLFYDDNFNARFVFENESPEKVLGSDYQNKYTEVDYTDDSWEVICDEDDVDDEYVFEDYYPDDEVGMTRNYTIYFDEEYDEEYDDEDYNYYIKRIIGLPGETVRIDYDGNIYINGKVLEEDYGYERIEPDCIGRALEEIKLADDEYFVMGDNRNNSNDSREYDVANLKRERIKGKAVFRVWPLSKIGKINK